MPGSTPEPATSAETLDTEEACAWGFQKIRLKPSAWMIWMVFRVLNTRVS